MNGPRTEIAWGGGKWNGGHKRAVRPNVELALALAEDGLDSLKIVAREPKQAVVWRVRRGYDDTGEAVSSFRFDLHIGSEHIRRRKVERLMLELATTSMHELIHCIRAEEFPAEDIVEMAVTEGLAYVGSYMFASGLMRPEEARIATYEATIDDNLLDATRTSFERTARAERAGTVDDMLANEMWFTSPPDSLSAGILLGINAVQTALGQGASFAELMTVAPDVIMGINVH